MDGNQQQVEMQTMPPISYSYPTEPPPPYTPSEAVVVDVKPSAPSAPLKNKARKTKGVIIASTLLIAIVIVITAVVIVTTTGGGDSADVLNILVQSANTKQDWMDEMATLFNSQQFTTSSGKLMNVTIRHTGSSLNSSLEPTVWSPATKTWVDLQNANSQVVSDPNCPETANLPIGIAMWSVMAQALGWPTTSITWRDLIALVVSPNGWADYGRPQFGSFKYGHGHPSFSNSGRLSIGAQIHAFSSTTTRLDNTTVWNPNIMANVSTVQQSVFHYGRIDTDLLDKMVSRGPDYLHGVTNYESNVIRYNKLYPSKAYPFVFVYMADGTFWNRHPICVLDKASWVSAEQLEIGNKFSEFIREESQQREMIKYGLRPADPSFDVSSVANSPFTTANGVIPTISPETIPSLPDPSPEIFSEIVNMWSVVKKAAAVYMVFDTSGSMSEQGKMTAAINAGVSFVSQMNARDHIYITYFSTYVSTPIDIGGTLIGDVRQQAINAIQNLFPSGGTALYDATIGAVAAVNQIRMNDTANGVKRNYAIVLMTDGMDTSSSISFNQLLSSLPNNEDASQVHIHTIAFGAEANPTILQQIADETNGKSFRANVDDISTVYNYISAEF